MRRAPALIAVITLLLAAAASAQAQASAGLRLRPGDQLLVEIKNEPELSGTFTVTPEGTIMLPVIGAVVATASPFAALESSIRSSYARELADPDLLITPLQRVSIAGEVQEPGFQWVDTKSTVADLVVLAGGLLPSANRKHIDLVRDETAIRIAMRDGGIPEPMLLQSGDRLMVGRRNWLSENLPIFLGAAATVAAAAVTSLIVR